MCDGVDVSSHEYDENVLVNELESNVEQEVWEVTDCVPTTTDPERQRMCGRNGVYVIGKLALGW